MAMIITLTDGVIDADHFKQLPRKGSAQHPSFDENRPSRRCPGQVLWEIFRKNVTILGLPSAFSVLHIVCPHGRLRYYLLLTGIHRLLAPLFTIIRIY
jgi:hypothetical protein